MGFAEEIDGLIRAHVAATAPDADVLGVETMDDAGFVASETIGEVLDKLVILNIRIWHLEDAKAEADNDAEFGAIQRKLQSCFRSKRPRLVAALNEMLKLALAGRADLVEDEVVKAYKGEGG